ncbi:ABC transporter permease [Lampropedia aestuarii]|uniref:ABC transporter permease n=1 Tax=Lampropedia aestuarii TaxID=2562762 RepID=A0A4S5BZ69_9BURK|nr:iron chelate uptake ABC transporter family permease subunit [Lampropedia aestuarii]MDH5856795.1 iron chelate uptake ABC transporter family permease subunit [Lampropedia aestuarii]THJ36385.1 ABC transporter permease [Lampropedia aestuarii]
MPVTSLKDQRESLWRRALQGTGAYVLACLVLCGLALWSTLVGASSISLRDVLNPAANDVIAQVLFISRIPRTLALLLAGASIAVAGMIMQMVARNRFVEPATVGTVSAASLGMLVVALVAPGMALLGKMLIAACFALAATGVFLLILQRIPMRSALVVPLVGLVFAGVIEAVTSFLAYRFDMLQAIRAWTVGDFSAVLQGRYELLWVSLALTVAAFFAADRFTVIGMGESVATSLGVHYGRWMFVGLLIVAMVTSSIVVTVGVIPFLGLIVPNVVSLFMGDQMRRSVVWVAIAGAALMLLCDIIGRLVIHPFEIPIGTIMGVLGSVLFLALLWRKRAELG